MLALWHRWVIQIKVIFGNLSFSFWVRPSSVQFSHSVVSDSLWPHGLQHDRPPCPSPTPGVCLNLCPFSQWCHPTISSSVISFSSCLQSFPASGSFQMSQFFPSGGQSIGVSASALVLPVGADITQDLKKFWKHLLFSPKYCSDCQINLTINLLSGHCHVVCMMSTYFLDKCSLIFLNQDLSQLYVSV